MPVMIVPTGYESSFDHVAHWRVEIFGPDEFPDAADAGCVVAPAVTRGDLAGFLQLDRRTGEIGFGILEHRRRRGYARAALKELIAFVTASGSYDHLFAYTKPDNIGALKVLTGAGFAVLAKRSRSDIETRGFLLLAVKLDRT